MKSEPIKVSLIEKGKEWHKIIFPNLQIPVKVNKALYLKMLNSDEFVF